MWYFWRKQKQNNNKTPTQKENKPGISIESISIFALASEE